MSEVPRTTEGAASLVTGAVLPVDAGFTLW